MSFYTPASIAEVKELTAYALARIADCHTPDSPESAGAAFLTSVRDALVDWAADGEVTPDAVTELADAAPDVYTHTLWSEFVDLGAYREDVTELGGNADDMEQCARIALYMIAERLCSVLVDDLVPAACAPGNPCCYGCAQCDDDSPAPRG